LIEGVHKRKIGIITESLWGGVIELVDQELGRELIREARRNFQERSRETRHAVFTGGGAVRKKLSEGKRGKGGEN